MTKGVPLALSSVYIDVPSCIHSDTLLSLNYNIHMYECV